MTPRFRQGSKAYTRDGRVYVVEAVEGSTVYCTLPNGTETEFPESALLNEQEVAAQTDGRRDASYARIRQAAVYKASATKLDHALAQRFIAQADRLIPGLLDYVAFTVGIRVLSGDHNDDLVAGLSIVKCRKIFDAVSVENRVAATAEVFGLAGDKLLSAAALGDNMALAMLETGMGPHAAAFEEFCDRPRR